MLDGDADMAEHMVHSDLDWSKDNSNPVPNQNGSRCGTVLHPKAPCIVQATSGRLASDLPTDGYRPIFPSGKTLGLAG